MPTLQLQPTLPDPTPGELRRPERIASRRDRAVDRPELRETRKDRPTESEAPDPGSATSFRDALNEQTSQIERRQASPAPDDGHRVDADADADQVKDTLDEPADATTEKAGESDQIEAKPAQDAPVENADQKQGSENAAPAPQVVAPVDRAPVPAGNPTPGESVSGGRTEAQNTTSRPDVVVRAEPIAAVSKGEAPGPIEASTPVAAPTAVPATEVETVVQQPTDRQLQSAAAPAAQAPEPARSSANQTISVGSGDTAQRATPTPLGEGAASGDARSGERHPEQRQDAPRFGAADGTAPAENRAAQVQAGVHLEQQSGRAKSQTASVSAFLNGSAMPTGEAVVATQSAPGAAVPLANALGDTGTATAGGTPVSQTAEEPGAQKVIRGLGAMVLARGGAMTMRLAPAELGELNIRMAVRGGAVTVDMTVQNAAAQQAIERSLGALRSALESHGLTVERLGVNHAEPARENSSSQNHDGQSREDAEDEERDAADGRSRGRHDEDDETGARRGTYARRTTDESSGVFTEWLDRTLAPERAAQGVDVA